MNKWLIKIHTNGFETVEAHEFVIRGGVLVLRNKVGKQVRAYAAIDWLSIALKDGSFA